jgi:hypothetical protein
MATPKKLVSVDISYHGFICDRCLRQIHALTAFGELDHEIVESDDGNTHGEVCGICRWTP